MQSICKGCDVPSVCFYNGTKWMQVSAGNGYERDDVAGEGGCLCWKNRCPCLGYRGWNRGWLWPSIIEPLYSSVRFSVMLQRFSLETQVVGTVGVQAHAVWKLGVLWVHLCRHLCCSAVVSYLCYRGWPTTSWRISPDQRGPRFVWCLTKRSWGRGQCFIVFSLSWIWEGVGWRMGAG